MLTGRTWSTMGFGREAGVPSGARRDFDSARTWQPGGDGERVAGPAPVSFDFAKIPLMPPTSPTVQAKLDISQPGDASEREADAVAERVVQRKPLDGVGAGGPLVQRKCSACEAPMEEPKGIQRLIQRKCSACSAGDEERKVARMADLGQQDEEKKVSRMADLGEDEEKKKREEETVLRKAEAGASSGPSAATVNVPSQLESARGRGQPLPGSVRADMESSFGVGFEGVRIHTDTEAVQLNRTLKAQAFTYGNDIFFNQGRFSPGSSSGRFLLAHELTHTIQQGGGVKRKIQRRTVCDPNGACRTEPDVPETEAAAQGGEEPLNYTPSAGMAAAAMSLAPPGDCTPGEHARLQAEVDRACDRERRCFTANDCGTLWSRINANSECIRARVRINTRCFRGGDVGHNTAVAYAVNALSNCWTIYERKCQQRQQPARAPERAPATSPSRSPTMDRDFMQRMSELTGLTGAALIAYLIISEGSRLFPPRNLIPVP